MNELNFARSHYLALHHRLQAQDPTLDEETLADTIEGLTDMHEIIAAIIRSALTDEAYASGLKLRIEDMQTRLERLRDRASSRRALVRDVMVETGIKKITAPDFTLSTRSGVPSLVVNNEAEIPHQFWVPVAPRLNRQELLTRLKAGDEVPGVQLSNAETVISVRTK